MEAQRDYKEIYADWEREMKDLGRQEGRRTGLIEGISALCDVLQIDLPTDRREQLESCDIQQLEQTLTQLRTTRHWPGS